MSYLQIRKSRSARIVLCSLEFILVQRADDNIRCDTISHGSIITRSGQIHHGGADSTAIQLLPRVRLPVEDAVEVGPERTELVRLETARFAAYVSAGERERTYNLRDAAYELAVGDANPHSIEAGVEGLWKSRRASQAYCVGPRKQTL